MELGRKHLAIVIAMMEDKFSELPRTVAEGNALHSAILIKELDSLAELGIAIATTEKPKRAVKPKQGKHRPTKKTRTSSRKKTKTSRPPASDPVFPKAAKPENALSTGGK